jgi:hypothetical protein
MTEMVGSDLRERHCCSVLFPNHDKYFKEAKQAKSHSKISLTVMACFVGVMMIIIGADDSTDATDC